MKILGLVHRYSVLTDPQALTVFFKSCVLPVVTYGSPIWTTSCRSNIEQLWQVYKFFVSILKHRVPHFRTLPQSDILNCLNVPLLTHILKYTDMTFFYALINGLIHAPLVLSAFNFYTPAMSLRVRKLFLLPKTRITLQQRFLFWRLPNTFNDLASTCDLDLFVPKTQFKSGLKKRLRQET